MGRLTPLSVRFGARVRRPSAATTIPGRDPFLFPNGNPVPGERHPPHSSVPCPGHRVLLPVSRTPAALGAAWKRVPRFVSGTGWFPCAVFTARPSRSQCEGPFPFSWWGLGGCRDPVSSIQPCMLGARVSASWL